MKNVLIIVIKGFVKEEDGLGVVELVLIIVILIALVILFKDEVEKFINSLFEKATDRSDGI
ncbi:Flp1 family type IVb pilin [Anaerosporobacter sp.]